MKNSDNSFVETVVGSAYPEPTEEQYRPDTTEEYYFDEYPYRFEEVNEQITTISPSIGIEQIHHDTNQ